MKIVWNVGTTATEDPAELNAMFGGKNGLATNELSDAEQSRGIP